MPKKRIFTVRFDLPGDEFEYIQFDSDRSLLDADIVLFRVGFGDLDADEYYQGTPLFDKFTSPKVGHYLAHWRSELSAFVNAGNLAIVYATKPLQYFRYTGESTFSGTGRSRVRTNLVNPISSYAVVPAIEQVTGKTGREVKLTADAAYLVPYWKELSSYSDYEAFIEGKFSHRVLVTKNGDKTVGAALRGKGSLLFLPPLHLDDERFLKNNSNGTFWTAEALKFGKRLVVALGALADALKLTSPTPPPAWAQDPTFTTIEESQLQTSIAKATKELDRLTQKRTRLEQQLNEAGKLRGLLYEKARHLNIPCERRWHCLVLQPKGTRNQIQSST